MSFYFGYYDVDGNRISDDEWASMDRWHLANECGNLYVSTALIGMDHGFGGGPPIIFETMVFGGPGLSAAEGDWECYQVRYETKEEAAKGHWLTCLAAMGTHVNVCGVWVPATISSS